jgi:hypothetical protein
MLMVLRVVSMEFWVQFGNGCISTLPPGRDGALRCPRRVQRRNIRRDSHVLDYSFSPLNAGCDGAARHPYQQW